MLLKTQLLSEPTTTDDDIVQPDGPTFKIFTGALKAYEKDGDTRKYLRCTASSSVDDLHGDRMTEDCVMGMAPQAKAKQMTIFLNHSYKWPEDVFGKTVDATVVSRASNPDGSPIYDLDLEIQLNESNQRAVDTFTAIKEQGIKAGVSIGAMIEDYAFKNEEEGFWGGLEIKAVDLLEASVVGIPANQRSWVVNALKALGAPKQILKRASGEPFEAPAKEAPESVTDDVEAKDQTGSEAPVIDENSAAPDEETPVEDSADESESTDEEKAAKPSLEDGIDQIKAASINADLSVLLLEILEGAAEEVASLRDANAQLVKERDEAVEGQRQAAEIVETIAHTPIGRKAQFVSPVSTFRTKFGKLYSDETLRLIEGAQDDNA